MVVSGGSEIDIEEAVSGRIGMWVPGFWIEHQFSRITASSNISVHCEAGSSAPNFKYARAVSGSKPSAHVCILPIPMAELRLLSYRPRRHEQTC